MAKTNLSKLLPKLIKKGGQQVKDLTQKILDNAAASTKRKLENDKNSKEDLPAKGAPADSTGLKRARDMDSGLQSGPKRMAVTSNLKDAAKAAPGSTKGAQMNKLPGAAALRPKPNVVAPKPSSLFGTLSSASKRPGTTNAERAAAAAAAKPRWVYFCFNNFEPQFVDSFYSATGEKEKAPAPKPSFSFGDIMADLNKPKEAPSPKPTEEHPPETEEQRAKRLRKEERRKLRVTWKPDDNLTEVRLFTHDPDEELGPGDGSMRSLGDVKGEGSVLKLHKDMEELEEEDMGGIRETVFSDEYNLSSKSHDISPFIMNTHLHSQRSNTTLRNPWTAISSSVEAHCLLQAQKKKPKTTERPPHSWFSTHPLPICPIHPRNRQVLTPTKWSRM